MPAASPIGFPASIPLPASIANLVGSYLGRIADLEHTAEGIFAWVEFELGRFRLPVSGNMAEGDLLRLIFAGGALRAEKQAAESGQAAARQPGLTLVANFPAFRELAVFEEALSRFLASPRNPAPRSTSEPLELPSAAPRSDPRPTPFPGQVPLPESMRRMLEKEGGAEFLVTKVAELKPETLRVLTQSLAGLESSPDAETRRVFAGLLQGLRRARVGEEVFPDPGAVKTPPVTPESNRIDRGVILERMVSSRSESPSAPVEDDRDPSRMDAPARTRYRIDLGNHAVVESAQGLPSVHFLKNEAELPAELRPAFHSADASGKTALLLAAEALNPIRETAGFVPVVRDFAALLVDTGRLGPGASMPSREELDGLLRLLLAFPRNPEAPALQARIWSEAVRNPEGLPVLLKTLRPGRPEEALFDSGMTPRMAARGLGSEEQEALNQAFQSVFAEKGGLRDAFADAAGGKATAIPIRTEGNLEKFLWQAMAGMDGKDWEEGRTRTLYFYHQDQWRPAEALWTRANDNRGPASDRAGKSPLRLQISTQTKNLGAVEVDLVLDTRGSRLDFRDARGDAKEHLSQSLPPLENLLRELGLGLAAWSYAPLAIHTLILRQAQGSGGKGKENSGVDLLA